jgi:hypothetical protein
MSQLIASEKESWTDGIALTPGLSKVETDPFGKQFSLFVTRFPRAKTLTAPHPWALECDSWMEHVNAYAHLKCGLPEDYDFKKPPTERLGDTRVRFLFDHLAILDGKFNLVLTFNSLLLLAMNILLGVLFNLVSTRPDVASKIGEYRSFIAFVACEGLFGFSWMAVTIGCLVSLRRLVWGDLRKTSEHEHVKQLIIAVARRTNAFRISVFATVLNICLAVGGFIAVAVLRWVLRVH